MGGTVKGIVWNGFIDVTDELEVRQPGPTEVLVAVAYAGVCHSDYSVVSGTIPFPPPVVLGHEGAGVVEAIGSAVTKVGVGDRVVLHTLTACGACDQCDRGRPTHCRSSLGGISQPFTYKGEPAYAFANAAVFSEYTVVSENQAVRIDPEVPLQVASLLGCAVMTGAGAALSRAKVERGSSALVIGVGGIGLSAIQGCRIAGATTIVAVDVNPEKETLARQFGATHFIGVDGNHCADAVRRICPDGVHSSFECVGRGDLSRICIEALAGGGSCVLVGTTPPEDEVSFRSRDLWLDKNVMGCRYGSAQPHHDIATYIRLYKAGLMKLDEMVTNVYPMDDVQRAFDDMAHGTVARSVLAVSGNVG
jgi:S-(hydroxymethyl)glutathione dehydrogenase/alcohol dehydrogenase